MYIRKRLGMGTVKGKFYLRGKNLIRIRKKEIKIKLKQSRKKIHLLPIPRAYTIPLQSTIT